MPAASPCILPLSHSDALQLPEKEETQSTKPHFSSFFKEVNHIYIQMHEKHSYTHIHTFSLSTFSIYTITMIEPKTGLQHVPFTSQKPKVKSLMPIYKFLLLTVL